MSRIFVTGVGIISAIGNSLNENHASLLNGKCGISYVNNFPSKYASELPFGAIQTGNDALKDKLGISNPSVTRTTLLAIHAANDAVEDAALTKDELTSADTAFIGATTVGGMCLTDELYRDANENYKESPYLSSYDCASVFLYLQEYYHLNGIIDTINTACSSSANAIMYGARLIKNGLAKRAIVGGADSLSKFTINGFNALHILSDEVCTPFDEGRKGLNLGEGAAFLVLEKEEDVAGKKIYAEVTGYHNTSDAFHPSSLSDNGEGPFLSMQGALRSAQLQPNDIDFINAHGTGTENNDEAESRAMIRIFNTPPPFASTKSNTGHTLGAAGAIESVYSILSIVNQEIYPGLHFTKPIQATGLEPVVVAKQIPVNHVMSNSFGFGGNCTSLIFSKA
ncbi:beta-ketoacyl-[acyl-carrier-protein] synthase family protein [Danxiaibacter flavus]|uniref:Beta-ketoacyl-[acyl-carrier-protein] synthase family protein n=1 Tax=Danxiaibacter flavus TaxID=3049108 RepID=A0ABV3ZE02_9BACT|nr:beta-ketoacyl-[acyl-carrier-protein] synthase family protein [Chitinophagaceae bacterium DXS]